MRATLAGALALLRKRNRPPKRRRIRKLRLLALLVVLGLLGLSAFTFGLLTAIAAQIPALDPTRQQRTEQRNTYVYASDGHTILAILRGSQARIVVPSEDISPWLKHAIVAIEDKRFYEHRGVDVRGHHARRLGGHHEPRHGAGRLDDHAAVREERDQRRRADDLAQAPRGGARVAARAGVDEGPDPHRVPEHDLLRQRRLRRRAGMPRSTSATAPTWPMSTRPRRRCSPGSPRTRASTTRSPTRRSRARAATSCCARCSPSTTSTPYQYRALQRVADAGPAVDPALRDAGHGGAVLRELRHRPARATEVRRKKVFGGGLPRDDDDRPGPAEDRARRDREGAAAVDRADARRSSTIDVHTGRRRRDGRRPELPPEPVQPRDAGRAPARLVVQAVRARGGAQGGDLAGDDARLAAGRRSTRAAGCGTSTTTRASTSARST